MRHGSPRSEAPACSACPSGPSHHAGERDHNKRVIDEGFVVWYIPCENSPATWVAAMIIYHVPFRVRGVFEQRRHPEGLPRAHYGTTEARERLEAVLGDDALMALVVTRPECPQQQPGRLLTGISGLA